MRLLQQPSMMLVLFALAGVASAIAADQTVGLPTAPPAFTITTAKPADRVHVCLKEDAATFKVSSPSGIGGATVALSKGSWPATVVLRLYLSGLESFAVSNGKVKLTGSVLSHNGQPKRLYLTEPNGEEERPPGTEIKVFDARGRPATGLPAKGGYFEVRLPKVLFDGQPKSLELGWIDFYRR